MRTRATATIVLSGALVAIGVAQVVRAAITGASVLAWVIGVLLAVAGGGRLWIWWRTGGT